MLINQLAGHINQAIKITKKLGVKLKLKTKF